MEDNKKQTRSEYVENSVRAMRDMYQAEGQPFNEDEARANAEKEWDKNNIVEIKGLDKAQSAPEIKSQKDARKERITDALKSVLNGKAFVDRIGR